jgi:hypothetical protein
MWFVSGIVASASPSRLSIIMALWLFMRRLSSAHLRYA